MKGGGGGGGRGGGGGGPVAGVTVCCRIRGEFKSQGAKGGTVTVQGAIGVM